MRFPNLAVALLMSAALVAPGASGQAVPTATKIVAGKPCARAGKIVVQSSKRYRCTRVKGRLVWKVVTPTPAPTTPAFTGEWQFDWEAQRWLVPKNAVKCKRPLIADGTLVDFSRATGKLLPGQYRPDYKPHGGLWFSESGSNSYVSGITVRAPFDGTITDIWHHLENGVYQFGMNIQTPCGATLRMGHLYEPGPVIAKYISDLVASGKMPSAAESTAETFVHLPIKKGDVLATNIGTPDGPNARATMDIGLLDLWQVNPRLPESMLSTNNARYLLYAVCWFEDDWLGPQDQAIVQALPIIGGNHSSDRCAKSY